MQNTFLLFFDTLLPVIRTILLAAGLLCAIAKEKKYIPSAAPQIFWIRNTPVVSLYHIICTEQLLRPP
jgi:hypothetical protein